MTTPEPVYSVILKADIPSVEREFLRRYCHEIHGDDGSTLLHFLCTSIDLSHPAYVEMHTYAPKSDTTSIIRIPHGYVLIIDGGVKRTGIGFMNNLPLPGK